MIGTVADGRARLQVYDYVRPGLDAGTYTIEAGHTVTLSDDASGDPSIPSARHSFTVQGPRFALEPSEVHAVYPPANATGPYGQTLPHVVLSTRTLPWERALTDQPHTVPWLALLVFDASDLTGASDSPVGAITMTVKALLDTPSGVTGPRLSGVSAAERDLTCQTIQLAASRLTAIAPNVHELAYLAHVRQIDATGQPGAQAGDVGWYALVVANRFPAVTAAGAKSIAHLVSLEGHEALLDGTAEVTAQTQVRLVSLASWTFTSTPDTDAAGETFKELALGLAQARAGERADLALGLPFDQQALQLPASDPRRRVADRLAAGYAPVSYHLPTGEATLAWYRGPFAARESAPVANARPFLTSSEAMIYDAGDGMFDISLATAWQIGRAVALADRRLTTELVRFRRGAHRLVDRVLAGLQSAHLDTPGDLAEVVRSGLIEQQFMDRLRADLPGDVAGISQGSPSNASQRSPSDAGLSADPVAAVKELLAQADLGDLVQAEVHDDLEPIAEWLAQLTLLRGVPFAYLVAHPLLLPIESARFFTLDQDWIGALVDGALSVGVQCSRDSWFQQVVGPIASDAAREVAQRRYGDADRASGLLVRSALVAGWPAITVTASNAGAPSALLRCELLAPDVLLCLFAGAPDRVELCAPHQSVHFGVEEWALALRSLREPIGRATGQQIALDGSWRPGGDRVLDVTGLVGRLAGALGPPLGSADLALQMLWAPEHITFTRP